MFLEGFVHVDQKRLVIEVRRNHVVLDIGDELIDKPYVFYVLVNSELIVHIIADPVGVFLEEEQFMFIQALDRIYLEHADNLVLEKNGHLVCKGLFTDNGKEKGGIDPIGTLLNDHICSGWNGRIQETLCCAALEHQGFIFRPDRVNACLIAEKVAQYRNSYPVKTGNGCEFLGEIEKGKDRHGLLCLKSVRGVILLLLLQEIEVLIQIVIQGHSPDIFGKGLGFFHWRPSNKGCCYPWIEQEMNCVFSTRTSLILSDCRYIEKRNFAVNNS